MNVFEALLLGIVQGITEFLPVSSSGHLILLETILGLDVGHLADFDIVVHIATLVAILVYFRQDISKLLKVFFRLDFVSTEGKMNLKLILATMPAVIFGLSFGDLVTSFFRDYRLVALLMFFCGIYFLFVESRSKGLKNKELSFLKAFFIGLAQSIAILPGISRSGSTIATAVLLGIDRITAARFSFLLGSIAITGAGVLLGGDLVDNGLKTSFLNLAIGFFASLVASYLTVSFLMKFFIKNTLKPFGYYLMTLSSIVLLASLF